MAPSGSGVAAGSCGYRCRGDPEIWAPALPVSGSMRQLGLTPFTVESNGHISTCFAISLWADLLLRHALQFRAVMLRT
jgi:hypothetical protein